VDFVVEHPLAPSRWPLHIPRITRALADAEAHKRDGAEARCARHLWDFQGAAFSVWGAPGPAATRLLSDIARVATHGLAGQRKSIREAEIRQNISIVLARSLARQLRLADRVADLLPDTLQE
jgi:hypothetical protein